MTAFKLFEQLIIENEVKSEGKWHQFSNPVFRVRKKPPISDKPNKNSNRQKYKNVWYLKGPLTKNIAIREVLAQEFIRLFMPNAPKTRLVRDKDGSYYVLSKEIPGFRDVMDMLSHDDTTSFTDGKIKGLGEIVVLALLLKEIDLKLGNLALDDKNNLFKIDGNMCFANFLEGFNTKQYCITNEELEALPRLNERYARNWLFFIDGDAETSLLPIKQAIHFEPSDTFRTEVNQTIFKLLLLPKKIVKDFISIYAGNAEEADILYQDINASIAELHDAAFKNQSFRNYLSSGEVSTQLSEFTTQVAHFKTVESQPLVKTMDSQGQLQNVMQKQFDVLVDKKGQLEEDEFIVIDEDYKSIAANFILDDAMKNTLLDIMTTQYVNKRGSIENDETKLSWINACTLNNDVALAKLDYCVNMKKLITKANKLTYNGVIAILNIYRRKDKELSTKYNVQSKTFSEMLNKIHDLLKEFEEKKLKPRTYGFQ